MPSEESLKMAEEWLGLMISGLGGDSEVESLAALLNKVRDDAAELAIHKFLADELPPMLGEEFTRGHDEERAKWIAAVKDMQRRHMPLRIWPDCDCKGCKALKGEEE